MRTMSEQVKGFIREAIKLEIRGKEFFNQAAETTPNALGKKMFKRLAEEEVKHLDAFSKLFSAVIKSTEWKAYVKDEELRGKSAVIEELVSRLEKAKDKSDLEAIRIGMELELKAIEFFKSAAENGDDSLAKEIFLKISEEEHFHYDLLQAQYDSLAGTGFWLDSSEFQMDGKY